MLTIAINALINIKLCIFVVIYEHKVCAFRVIYLCLNVILLRLLYY